MTNKDLLGRVVYSDAGRDIGNYFIIVGIIDENYVYISDGSLRKIQNPKKKKVKHLIFSDIIVEDLKEMILAGENVSNKRIKKFLQSVDINKEV